MELAVVEAEEEEEQSREIAREDTRNKPTWRTS
jgi:hypothetical protein